MEGPRKSESLRLLSVRIEIGNLKLKMKKDSHIQLIAGWAHDLIFLMVISCIEWKQVFKSLTFARRCSGMLSITASLTSQGTLKKNL